MDDVIISSNEALQALKRSEIDMQIAPAKQYPRDLSKWRL